MTVTGTFELSICDDGKHATVKFVFPEMTSDVRAWLRFTYCNDIVWRHHAGNIGSPGGVELFSMIRMDLYQKLFRHIHGDQFIVPGSD